MGNRHWAPQELSYFLRHVYPLMPGIRDRNDPRLRDIITRMQADLDASGHSRRTYNEDMLYQLYYRRYNLNRAHRGDLNMNMVPNGHGRGAGSSWGIGRVADRGVGRGGFGLGRGNGNGGSEMQARAPAPAPAPGVSSDPRGFVNDTSAEHRTVPQIPLEYPLEDDNEAGEDFRSLFEDYDGQEGEREGGDGLFVSQNGDRQRGSRDDDFGSLEPGVINSAAFISTHGGANPRSPSPSFGHGNMHTTNLPVSAVSANQSLGLKWEDLKWLSQNGSNKGGAKKSKGIRGHKSSATQSEEARLAVDPAAFQASERRKYGSIRKGNIAREKAMRENPGATIVDLSAPVQVQELLAPIEFRSVEHPVIDPALYMSVDVNENDAEYDVPAVGRLAPYAKHRSGRFEALGEGSMQGTPPPYRAAYAASLLKSQDKQSVEENAGGNESVVPSNGNDAVYKPQYAFPDLVFKQVLKNVNGNKSMADAESSVDKTLIPHLQRVEKYKGQTNDGWKNANINDILASACPTPDALAVKPSTGNLSGANLDGNFAGFRTMGSLRRSEIDRDENRHEIDGLMTRYLDKSRAQDKAKNSGRPAAGKPSASMVDSHGIPKVGRRFSVNPGARPQTNDVAMSFSVSKSNSKAKPVVEKMPLSGFRIPKRGAPSVPLDFFPASQPPKRPMTWKPLIASDPGVQMPSNSGSGSSHSEESRAAKKVQVKEDFGN